MASSLTLLSPHLTCSTIIQERQQWRARGSTSSTPTRYYFSCSSSSSRNISLIIPIKAAAAAEAHPLSSFPLFQSQGDEDSDSELELADPDFYKIGYARQVRTYSVNFKEGPDGFGVYASKDVAPTTRPRMIMEIPIELMLTISKNHPWMFFPNIVPLGHPIFEIINSTDPEADWDLRMACLLLFAFDVEGNFWQLYGDFLPSADQCTSLLLATKLELQDTELVTTIEKQQHRALEFWEKELGIGKLLAMPI